jgi:hypothetical protein
MKWMFILLVGLHASIHLLGVVKGFGWADVPQLTRTIPPSLGVLWLAAAVALATAAVLTVLDRPEWWVVGLVGVVLSQMAIATAWSDAWAGTIANVLVLAGVVYGAASVGPFGLASEYRALVREATRDVGPREILREDDAGHLPEPVRCYLREAGWIGAPRVHHVRMTWRGRIRSGPDAAWMPFTAEQVNVVGEPARFFLMRARRGGVPVDVLHVYRAGTATMRVRPLSLVQIVHARGPEMDVAETVTVLNDMTLFHPTALVDADIDWESLDERTVRATYRAGPEPVSAVITFDDDCMPRDFVSDDRYAASPDGASFERLRWSTPVQEVGALAGRRVVTRGEGVWHAPSGPYAYTEMEIVSLKVDGGDR